MPDYRKLRSWKNGSMWKEVWVLRRCGGQKFYIVVHGGNQPVYFSPDHLWYFSVMYQITERQVKSIMQSKAAQDSTLHNLLKPEC